MPATPSDDARLITPAEAEAGAAGTGAYSADTPPDPKQPVPKWAVHRRLYDWVLGFSKSRHSTPALAGISFAESSFFPIPPDVLLLPLCLGARRKAFWFATICTIASVLGGALGYAIGVWGMDLIGERLLDVYDGDRHTWAKIEGWYATYGFLGILIAAITPIPYKVFTIASGALGFAFWPFMLASVIGRGIRFFAVATLMYFFGERIVPFIDKYFNLLSILFVVLGVGGFVLLKVL